MLRVYCNARGQIIARSRSEINPDALYCLNAIQENPWVREHPFLRPWGGPPLEFADAHEFERSLRDAWHDSAVLIRALLRRERKKSRRM